MNAEKSFFESGLNFPGIFCVYIINFHQYSTFLLTNRPTNWLMNGPNWIEKFENWIKSINYSALNSIHEPWGSYPPPIPLWALKKPRRDFHPYFGIFQSAQTTSTSTKPPSTSSTPPTTGDSSSCRPDIVSGNLPWECIEIIQVTLISKPIHNRFITHLLAGS